MQLPSNLINKVFSEIDVREAGDKLEIFYSTMTGLSAEMSEGWKTGIALDASVSMIDLYGKGLEGSVPEDVKKQYIKNKWIEERKHDGQDVQYWKEDAYRDAIKKGYMKQTKNEVETETRKFSTYLAENLDEKAQIDLIYWACGESGKNIESSGTYDSAKCKSIIVNGPNTQQFGNGTYLAAALNYFTDKYKNAKRGLFIFITDGKIDDLIEVKNITTQLAKDIEAGKRNTIKAILIGLGNEIDEKQMIELDDIDTGTEVDIWDHKIAKDMKDMMEIFAELVDENTIIAPTGTIYDSNGNIIKKFNDGVPAKGKFTLPKDSTFFSFEVEGKSIKQIIKN